MTSATSLDTGATVPSAVEAPYTSESVEIIRFKVAAHTADSFAALRTPADQALRVFKGFVGSELLQGPGDLWTVIVRWASRADMLAAQAVTLGQPGLPEIAAWTAQTDAFVSFEVAEVRARFDNRNNPEPTPERNEE